MSEKKTTEPLTADDWRAWWARCVKLEAADNLAEPPAGMGADEWRRILAYRLASALIEREYMKITSGLDVEAAASPVQLHEDGSVRINMVARAMDTPPSVERPNLHGLPRGLVRPEVVLTTPATIHGDLAETDHPEEFARLLGALESFRSRGRLTFEVEGTWIKDASGEVIAAASSEADAQILRHLLAFGYMAARRCLLLSKWARYAVPVDLGAAVRHFPGLGFDSTRWKEWSDFQRVEFVFWKLASRLGRPY